jgi:hypothetical protein
MVWYLKYHSFRSVLLETRIQDAILGVSQVSARNNAPNGANSQCGHSVSLYLLLNNGAALQIDRKTPPKLACT